MIGDGFVSFLFGLLGDAFLSAPSDAGRHGLLLLSLLLEEEQPLSVLEYTFCEF